VCANSGSLHPDQTHAEMLRITAVEAICRMHGGSQPQLIRCSDDEYYVVKFQNNPQGARILANELMGTLLARELGLPTAEMAIIDVPHDVIRASKDMTIQLEHGRNLCHAGLCFGSRCPRVERSTEIWLPARVFDFPFEGLLKQTENVSEFAGMLVFNKWTGNTDDRQVILVPNFNPSGHRVYFALMIDQGFCFNGQGWDFPDVPKHGLCPVRGAYSHITGLTAFEKWLNRLEQAINRQTCGVTGSTRIVRTECLRIVGPARGPRRETCESPGTAFLDQEIAGAVLSCLALSNAASAVPRAREDN
jgi:hypothetical protein